MRPRPPLVLGAGPLLDTVGVDEITPRPHRPTERIEVQCPRRSDQLAFGLDEQLGHLRRARTTEHRHVLETNEPGHVT